MSSSVVPKTIAGVPTRAPSIGATRNYHLDAMRGIAALIVVFDHMRNAFFLPYKQAGNGKLVRFIYIDHYVAGAAVIFFFALSGYLVGTSVLRSHQRGTWSWSNYLLNRITRLWTVLIPALLLTAAFDAYGKWNPISAPTYFTVDPSNGYSLAPLDTVPSFFGTMFFVHHILTDIYGTLGPAWSLANEFWYYILFPVAVLCIAKGKLWQRLLYGVLFALIAVFVGKTIFLLFGTWLGGILAGWLAQRYPIHSAIQRNGLFAASFLLTLASILGTAAHKLSQLPGFYIIGVAAIGLIWSALCMPPGNRLYTKVAIFFSELSYTLYLTHQPMLILLSALWLHGNKWPPNAAHLALALVPISFAVLFAYGMYFLFESRTDSIRRYVKINLLDRFGALAA